MRKSLKIAGFIVGAIVLLIIVAAFALPFIVDPNDFKPRIEAAVEEATGRDFEIPGDIRLSVFPWLGVELGAVRLGEAPGFGDEPFASIAGVQVRVKLLPLLSRQIEVGKVVVEQPRVRLLRNAEGRANWDDLAGQADESAADEAPAQEPAATEQEAPDFSVDGIEVRDASVLYSDATAGQEVELSKLNVTLGSVSLPADFQMSASGHARLAPQAFATDFEFSARVAADIETERYSVRDARMKLTAEGKELPVSPLELRVEWVQAAADLRQDVAELRELGLTLLGVNSVVNADVRSLSDAMQANGSLNITAGDLAQTAKQLGDLIPEGVTLSGQARGNATFAYDQERSQAEVSEFALRALGLDVNGQLRASNLENEPAFEGFFKLAEFSPGQLLVRLGQELPATRDGEVFDRASMSANFAGTSNSLRIENLQAVLDQTSLNGRFEIADLQKQAMRFALVLDEIDADRYLPPADEQAAAEAGAEVPLDQMEIPADLVRGLDINGTLAIGKLKAFGFNSTDVNIGVNARNDVLRIHPAEAKFYGGGYRGDMRLDASSDTPLISVNENVDRIQLAPLMMDLFESEQLSGTAEMHVAATARGHTIGELRKTLDGSFSADVADGTIEGFNLWESIREAYEKFRGREYDASKAPQRTEFAELSASGNMKQGVITNEDLLAKLPFLNVRGAGSIDIAQETLDYTLQVQVLRSPELDGDALTNTTIPVRLSGPLTAPRVRPDVKAVLEAKAKEALQRKEEEAREAIRKKEQELKDELERKEQEERDRARQKLEEEKERAKDKLKDKLKGLFG